MLAERLEFFVPVFSRAFSLLEGLAYIAFWALFITGLQLERFNAWQDAVNYYVLSFIILFITIFTTVFLIEIQRPSLKDARVMTVCTKMLLTGVLVAIFAAFSVLYLVGYFGITDITLKRIVRMTALHAVNTGGFMLVMMIYYLRRHRDLINLQKSFEYRLATQNEYIKARLEPHFLFNTINTLISLIEVDDKKQDATDMLQHLSYLFRMSFNEPDEVNFEDEIELCEHYLAIEHYRLQDRLVVTWNLPDADLIYDMSIPSFSIQQVLEKTILYVAGLSTDVVFITITVQWQNNKVYVIVTSNIPEGSDINKYDLNRHLDFSVQENYLRKNFGDSAKIIMSAENQQIVTRIDYPLHDALF